MRKTKSLFYHKFILVGLGFKAFMAKYGYKVYIRKMKEREYSLWIVIGSDNYFEYTIPRDCFVKCKKKKIFAWSLNENSLNNFISEIRVLGETNNRYKLKGIVGFTEVPANFKLYQLKLGKKPR